MSVEDDPQRTQEWDAPPELAGATAAEAEAAAAAREAEAQAQRTAAEAQRAAQRAELSETDARRAEDHTAKAHEEVVSAEEKEEKLSRKERKAREKAAAAEAEAEQARAHAAEAEKQARQAAEKAPVRPPELSGAGVMSPGVGSETDPAAAASAYRPPVEAAPSAADAGPLDRPEVVAGIAFAGAFLLARIFKRLVD